MLFTEGQLRGQLAMWVCRQSPYRSVDGVDVIGALITEATKANDWFGPADCRMRHFDSWQALKAWLQKSVGDSDHPQLTKWNTPRSGHGAEIVFSSQYGGPSQDDDFIDIGALFHNVALQSWRESEAEAASNKRIDDAIASQPKKE